MPGNRIKMLRFLPKLLSLLLCCPAWGQGLDSSDQQTISQLVQQIKDLQQRDRELEERIKVLEANQKAASPAAPESSAGEVPAAPPVQPASEASGPVASETPIVAQVPLPSPLPPELHSV